MPADTFSAFLGMTLQATGNNNNAWGTILNGSALQTLEKGIAGNVGHAVTGGTLDLSGSPPPAAQTQMLEMLQVFTGVLTANQLVKVPNVSKTWVFSNQTTGAFQLLLQIGSGNIINIPQSSVKFVVCDGAGSLIRLDRDDVGTFVYSAGGTIPAGAIQCAGQSLLKTDYPDLYSKISTTYGSVDGLHFTLPLLTDTNRYLRAAGGALGLGLYQSNQNAAHTHGVTGAPAVGTLTAASAGDHFHTASISDPTHAHTYQQGTAGNQKPNGTGTAPFDSNFQAATGAAFTGVRVNSSNGLDTVNTAGAHTHNVTGSLTAGTLGTASSGGSEARPESLTVYISIKY